MLKKLIAVSLACLFVLGLASCQSTKLDTALRENLPKICQGAGSIHSAFVVIAATGQVKASVVNKERAAWAALVTVCRDPGSINSTNALVTAAEAYAAMIAALRESK